MASRRARSLRFVLPMVLGAVLAGEITGIALGRALNIAGPAAAAGEAVAGATASRTGDGSATAPSGYAVDAARDPLAAATWSDQLRARPTRPALATRGAPPAFRAIEAKRARPTAKTAPLGSHRASGGSSAAYHGTNHVWIPSLGINKGIRSFPCSRTRPPDAGVYRWGCAGRNNVYLLSHAWSTFEPLHDAYVGGRLGKGLKVVYADGSGTVHTYRVIWWKVVAPTTAASWAWASLGSPGMTLQTCVGSKSQYRLMVRLTRVS